MKLPSRLKLLEWLFLLASVIFLTPFIGAHLFHAVFPILWVQWVFWCLGLINTIVISLGVFLSLCPLFLFEKGSKERKKAGCMGFSFMGLFFFLLILQLSLAYATIRVTLLSDGFENDFVPKMISHISSAPTAKERKGWASIVYRLNGIDLPYKLDDGSYLQYAPTEKEKQEWVQNQATHKSIKEGQRNLDHLAHRTLLGVMINITVFFLIVSGGILYTTYRRGKETLP